MTFCDRGIDDAEKLLEIQRLRDVVERTFVTQALLPAGRGIC